ncbi:MAG: hypothetical protein U5J99_14855 [Parvularculaceae bacterium]|nr:hypothetical protein [Parvularculaceae bacterium]
MGTIESAPLRLGGVGRVLGALGGLVTLPAAVILALIGQFAISALIMAASPPPDPLAPAGDSAIWILGLMLFLQVGALVFALSRASLSPGRIFLAIAALVWAIASMLIMYVALQCDPGGICL